MLPTLRLGSKCSRFWARPAPAPLPARRRAWPESSSRHGARLDPATNAKRQQRPIVLESAELALDGGATPIQPATSLPHERLSHRGHLLILYRRVAPQLRQGGLGFAAPGPATAPCPPPR